jgi:hypothetical protein
MKRITPDEVLKAFLENSLVPIQDSYAEIDSGKECTCGLSALVIAKGAKFGFVRGVEDQENFVLETMKSEGFDPHYLVGFVLGFDGNQGREPETEELLLGKKDGQAAWEAVKHMGLPELPFQESEVE